MTTSPPTRRKWHLTRWLIVLIVATLCWSGWRAYTFRSALAEAKSMGWAWEYTYPSEIIRANWKAAFKTETWRTGVTFMTIPTSEAFERNLTMVQRLSPMVLRIETAATLRDLSSLKRLTRLQHIRLDGCTELTNVDALKNLTALQSLRLRGCKGLTNVDVLENLTALQEIDLADCIGLTNVDALKNLTALQMVDLTGCAGLTNVDVLKNLTALQELHLSDCKRLTNVDALMNLSSLRVLWLINCARLSKESVAALKAALPNAKITGP